MTGPLVRKLICATTAAGSIAVTAYLANLWLNAPTLNSMVPPPPANPTPQPQEEEKHAASEDSAEEGDDEENAEQEDVESKEPEKTEDSSQEDIPPPPPSPPSEISIEVQDLDPSKDQARLKDYIVYKLGEIKKHHEYWQQNKTFLLTNWKLYYLDPLLKSIKKYKQSINDATQNTSNPPGNDPASPGSPSSNGAESGG